MKQDELRYRLIDGTVHVIAHDGLDKATTKQIGIETGINEAYIYRCFTDKEDLLARTFDSLDDELVSKAMAHIEIMYMDNMSYELRCWVFYSAIWKFVLGNKDKCLAFVRYYYSTYYKKYSAEEHKKRYMPLVDRFSEAFRDEANVWMLLKHILNVMLDFAVRVYEGEASDSDDTAQHVFYVVYNSIKPYFKEKVGSV